MGAKDGETHAPRGDNGELNSQPGNNDGKNDAAFNLRISKPLKPLPTTISPKPYPPTPAFGFPAFTDFSSRSFSQVEKKVKEEKATPTTKPSASDEEPPPAKRMKLDFTDTLQVDVGPLRHAFHVPRKLATSRSPLLAKNYKQGEAIFLPDEDVQVFSIWLQIILQGQVVVDDEENALDQAQVWHLMVQTYVLSLQLGDVQSMNITMDEIVRRFRFRAFSQDSIAQAVKYTFEHTSSDSKLRRVFVDFAVYRASDRSLFLDVGSYDFLSEVIMEYTNWRDMTPTGPGAFGGRKGKFGEDPRQYHVKDAAAAGVKR